ncbi:MAG: saccharopine dehydrogenase NADP-binding domain-containing protein [Saccharofermentans sp.]|nr:saccharopine dehydrogenase NADP-binding domain-containing protein [Saccharofermentans sp.]
MKKVLILGCGDKTEMLVSRLCDDGRCVSEICLASKDKSECNEIKNKVASKNVRIITSGIDVTNTEGAMMMANIFGPDLIINLMPSELTEHVLCLALNVKAAYLDFKIDDVQIYPKEDDVLGTQFRYFAHFKGQGVTAVTGCGYDPALLAACIRNANGKDFDKIEKIDLIKAGKDSNAMPKEASAEAKPEEEKVVDEVLLYRDDLPSDEDEVEETVEEETEEGAGAVMLKDGHMVFVADPKPEKEKTKYYRLVSDILITDFIKEFPDFKNVRCIKETVAAKKPAGPKKPTKEELKKEKKKKELLDTLEKLGLLSDEPVRVGNSAVIPLEVVKSCLPVKAKAAPKKKEPLYPDETYTPIAAIRITGTIGGKKKIMEYKVDNPDLNDVENKIAVAAAKMMCLDRWVKPGVFTTARFPNNEFMEMLALEGVNFVSEEIGAV